MNHLIQIIEQKISRLENSGNSQNICGEYHKDGQIEAFKECLVLLKQELNNDSSNVNSNNMTYIEKRGIKPTTTKNKTIYRFSEDEIISLIQDYILQEIGAKVELTVNAGDDPEFDDFSVDLADRFYDYCDQTLSDEQLDKIFEAWDMELHGSEKILSEIFVCDRDNMTFQYDEDEEECIVKIDLK